MRFDESPDLTADVLLCTIIVSIFITSLAYLPLDVLRPGFVYTDAKVDGHTTMAMHDIEYTPPYPLEKNAWSMVIRGQWPND